MSKPLNIQPWRHRTYNNCDHTRRRTIFYSQRHCRDWPTLLSPRCFNRGLRPVCLLSYVYTVSVAGFIVDLTTGSTKRWHPLLPCHVTRSSRQTGKQVGQWGEEGPTRAWPTLLRASGWASDKSRTGINQSGRFDAAKRPLVRPRKLPAIFSQLIYTEPACVQVFI